MIKNNTARMTMGGSFILVLSMGALNGCTAKGAYEQMSYQQCSQEAEIEGKSAFIECAGKKPEISYEEYQRLRKSSEDTPE